MEKDSDKEEFVFRGQRPDEEVDEIIRQHPWVMAKTGVLIVIFANILVMIIIKFGASSVSSWATFAFLILCLYLGWYRWFMWHNSVYLITSQRILKIEQVGFFHRVITEAELERLQEITMETKGPWQTMMNYGNIHINTNTAEDIIELPNVSDPYDLQQKIDKAAKFSKHIVPGKMEFRDTFESEEKTDEQKPKVKIIR